MKIREFFDVPARQPLTMVAVLVVGLGLALAVHAAVPGRYTSTSVLAVTASPNGPTLYPGRPMGRIDGQNPLLGQVDSRNYTAKLIIEALSDPSVFPPLATGTTVETNNGTDDPSRSPISSLVFVSSNSTSATESREAVQVRTERAEPMLAQTQAVLGAPASTDAHMIVVVPPTVPRYDGALRWRSALGAAGAAVTVGLVMMYIIAGFRRARPQVSRRAERRSSEHLELYQGVGQWDFTSGKRHRFEDRRQRTSERSIVTMDRQVRENGRTNGPR